MSEDRRSKLIVRFALVLTTLACVIQLCKIHPFRSKCDKSTSSIPWSLPPDLPAKSFLPAPPSPPQTSPPRCKLTDVTQDWSKKAELIVQNLHPNDFPSYIRPFVFFHLRKAGGSSMRNAIKDAALVKNRRKGKNKRNNNDDNGNGDENDNDNTNKSDDPRKRIWVACGTVTCREYIIPSHENYTVYGGHLYFADVANKFHVGRSPGMYNTFKPSPQQTLHGTVKEEPSFDCLVQFRPTVERTVSCWNYRVFKELRSELPKASQLTAEEWDHHLPRAFSRQAEGCNNEALRVFGSVADEYLVNTMTASGVTDETCPLVKFELDHIMGRLSQCVVMILSRCEESKIVLEHYYPWLAPKFDCDKAANVGPKDAAAATASGNSGLQPGADEIILKHNEIDEHVYHFAEALFEEQLKMAKGDSRSEEAMQDPE